MGSYGIGVGRNLACVVEAHHDEKGIVWPASVAPYAAHLVTVSANRDPRVTEVAEALHAHSIAVGNEILYDDRDESPGVKFTDAELLGMPWILRSAREASPPGASRSRSGHGREVGPLGRRGRGAAGIAGARYERERGWRDDQRSDARISDQRDNRLADGRRRLTQSRLRVAGPTSARPSVAARVLRPDSGPGCRRQRR